MIGFTLGLAAVLMAGVGPGGPAAKLSEMERFNLCVGTQTIGAAYQFTKEPLLVETARAILAMGSNTLKFNMGPEYAGGTGKNTPSSRPGIASLSDLARDEPAHRAVLDMPFANYLIWCYPFNSGWWSKGLGAADREKLYREFHDLAVHLFRTYNGSGKSFYLGHWEGDWHLRGGYETGNDDSVTPEAIQGMIDWINTRQKAIDDARRETPHRDVQVYGYLEVNLVRIAMQGRRTVTNDVLPRTTVDFVSYSSYDSQHDLKPALDYIESKLPPKRGIAGKRVFVGEYGFPAEQHTPAAQAVKSLGVIRAALEWGCPFVLYWEMYNNEVVKGKQRGFWLIDDKGDKTPLYEAHRDYYAWARTYLTEYRKAHRRLPSFDQFRAAAAKRLAGG